MLLNCWRSLIWVHVILGSAVVAIRPYIRGNMFSLVVHVVSSRLCTSILTFTATYFVLEVPRILVCISFDDIYSFSVWSHNSRHITEPKNLYLRLKCATPRTVRPLRLQGVLLWSWRWFGLWKRKKFEPKMSCPLRELKVGETGSTALFVPQKLWHGKNGSVNSRTRLSKEAYENTSAIIF